MVCPPFPWNSNGILTKATGVMRSADLILPMQLGVFSTLTGLDPDRIVMKDKRFEYGETRYQLISKIQDRVFVIIFTPCYNTIRIISARKANQREVKQYEKTSRDNQSPT